MYFFFSYSQRSDDDESSFNSTQPPLRRSARPHLFSWYFYFSLYHLSIFFNNYFFALFLRYSFYFTKLNWSDLARFNAYSNSSLASYIVSPSSSLSKDPDEEGDQQTTTTTPASNNNNMTTREREKKTCRFMSLNRAWFIHATLCSGRSRQKK